MRQIFFEIKMYSLCRFTHNWKMILKKWKEKGLKKHPSIHATLIISEMNVTVKKTCFRCGLEDHFIANCPKPETSDKKVHWNTENPKLVHTYLRK